MGSDGQEQTVNEAKDTELDNKDAVKTGGAATSFLGKIPGLSALSGPLGAIGGALGGVAGVLGIQKGVKQYDGATNGKDAREGALNVGKGANDIAKGGVGVAKTVAAAGAAAEAPAILAGSAEAALAGGATVEAAAAAANAPASAVAKAVAAGNTAAAQGGVLGAEAAAASTAGQVVKAVGTAGKVLGAAGGVLDAGIGINKIASDGATGEQKIDGASDVASGALTVATTLAAGPAAPLVLAANKLLAPVADDYSKKHGLFQDENGKVLSASESAARDGAITKTGTEGLLRDTLGVNPTVANVIGTGAGGVAKLGMSVGNNVVTGAHALGTGVANAASGAANFARGVWNSIPSPF